MCISDDNVVTGQRWSRKSIHTHEHTIIIYSVVNDRFNNFCSISVIQYTDWVCVTINVASYNDILSCNDVTSLICSPGTIVTPTSVETINAQLPSF